MRQVFVGVAPAAGTDDPDLLAAQLIAQRLEGRDLIDLAQHPPGAYERSATHPAAPLIAAVWRESERELRRCNAFEFDDLLACAVRLIDEHPHRLAWLRQRWRWLLADEFQDTSHAQPR
ncbi:MAG: UvrD-helicase domain-containing protein [Solirubrobacteraceae bacterium]